MCTSTPHDFTLSKVCSKHVIKKQCHGGVGFCKAGYQVFGLSADKPKSQANWKAKHNLNFTLLCDPSQEVNFWA